MKLKLQSVGVRASECTCPPVNKRRGWLDCCEFLRPQMSLTWSWISFSSHFTNIIEISTTSWHDFLKRFEPFEFCPVLSQSIWKSHCSVCWLWAQLVLPGSAGWSCVCRLLLFISQESVLNLTGSEPGQMCYQTNSQHRNPASSLQPKHTAELSHPMTAVIITAAIQSASAAVW